MSLDLILIPVAVALLCALVNLVKRQWVVNLAAMVLQYLAAFFLLTLVRPPNLAVVKLLVGWMVTLVLYVTLLSIGRFHKPQGLFSFSSGELFRLASGLLLIALVMVFSSPLQAAVFPQAPVEILVGSLGLITLGLLQLGTKDEPLYVILGFFTFFSGFELLYASLEYSTLIEALFALMNLGLGLMGAYILVKDQEVAQV